MNLGQIVHIIGQFVQLPKRNAEFDDLANFAQVQYFNANITNHDVVYPFVKYMGLDEGTPPLYVSVNGTALIPADYVKSDYESMTYLYNYGTYKEQRQVEVVDSFEFDNRKSHSTEIPTKEYPIATFTRTYIKFLPKTLQYVSFTYLGNPTAVHYATKINRGFSEYDPANSAELLWNEKDQIEIIKIILSQLGAIISVEQIKSKMEENQK